MKSLFTVVPIMALTASSWAAKPTVSQGPLPKNLASPTYRAPVTQVVTEEFTKKDAQKLAAVAETATDHLKIAGFYRGEAEALDARGAAYERAAAKFRNGPMVKNLAAPTTATRWELEANGFREEAASYRALATSHDRMAKNARASE